ncbi:MAG: hypothetical protein ABIF19_09200 [Planctomycetota bacterium]
MEMKEKQWQAVNDAGTLIEAEAIKKDKPRLKAARAILKKRLAATQQAIKET